MKRWPVLLSFLLFLGLCMSATYWVMQFIKPQVRSVAMPKQQAPDEADPEAAMGLFGGHLSVAAASNFQLKGVVVAKNEAESVAILVADGKSAEAVRANAEVIPGVTVKEVHSRYVLLSENGVIKRVELPESAGTSMGDASIVPQMPAPSPAPGAAQIPLPAPNTAQQIPQPQNGAAPPEADQNRPPPLPPTDPQGRIGRAAARMRNTQNN